MSRRIENRMERNRERRVWAGSRARGSALVFIWESGGPLSHASDCADCGAPSSSSPQNSWLQSQSRGPAHSPFCTLERPGPCSFTSNTRPRDLPAFPLPSCISVPENLQHCCADECVFLRWAALKKALHLAKHPTLAAHHPRD